MENIAEILEGVKTMGIGGHIRPDGDCVGSCMALYLYVKTYYPEIQADVYLDNPKPVFGHIDCMDEIKTELDGDKEYDLFVTIQLCFNLIHTVNMSENRFGIIQVHICLNFRIIGFYI